MKYRERINASSKGVEMPRRNQHSNRRQKGKNRSQTKFIKSRWACWWTTSHSREKFGSARSRMESSTPHGSGQLTGRSIGAALPPFRAHRRDQGREFGIEDHDVRQISAESHQLQRDQPNVSISGEKKLRSQMNCDRAANIHEKETRQQQTEVEPLVARHERVQTVAHFSSAIAHSHANEAQIIRKQQQTDGEKGCYKCEPAARAAKLCE